MTESATHLIAALMLLTGSIFMLLAAIGLMRMPDLLTRMHATTKASVLGAGLMLLGVALFFGSGSVFARMLAIIAFITLTSPVAAHIIGRAGHATKTPLWSNTIKDSLREEVEAREQQARR